MKTGNFLNYCKVDKSSEKLSKASNKVTQTWYGEVSENFSKF